MRKLIAGELLLAKRDGSGVLVVLDSALSSSRDERKYMLTGDDTDAFRRNVPRGSVVEFFVLPEGNFSYIRVNGKIFDYEGRLVEI